MADSPDLAAAKRLIDLAKDDGFTFERIALGRYFIGGCGCRCPIRPDGSV